MEKEFYIQIPELTAIEREILSRAFESKLPVEFYAWAYQCDDDQRASRLGYLNRLHVLGLIIVVCAIEKQSFTVCLSDIGEQIYKQLPR